ncbi:chromosome partitioning protein ParA [Jannaschia sp. EhC01]|uniref:Chromosome partitioning protein ParA n=1 Tax=Gymnodinialimonas phycosphaerae TaxID=2841589 RepID=A0A975YF13_9RHOB|nr:AAA family ATPase [Gymnodinialimonas phycosphaerae]MBY4894273.1 AAA family ATPase [Gymnodinialimonas phycosphaerae]OAN80094.1 chromosome partitioning protein ParA [Jannaschia sp. EhC01]
MRVVSITNQKGGVGKTTTAINLGAALAARGKSVLIADLDPQGNASTGLGIDAGARGRTTYDLLIDGAALEDVAIATEVENLSIAPATTDLSSTDVELGQRDNRVFLLKDALKQSSKTYDYVLIDCPPSLSLLTLNALVASDSILVPLQAEFFALEGLSQLMLTVREVRETANPSLRIEGVVLTMHDARNRLSRQVEDDARANLGDLVFKTMIPRNVRLSEAPSFAMPAIAYDPMSKGSQAYLDLAQELIDREVQTMEMS